jgi:ketosteroid isomerase-like protein
MRIVRLRRFPLSTGSVVIPFLAATALAGCGGAGAQGHEVEAVKGRVAAEVAAVNARNMKALSEVWSQTSDISLFDVAPPGRFDGWPGIAHTFNDFFTRLSDVKLTIDHLEVRVEGTLAYATYDWAMTGTLGGAKLDDRGQATSVFRKEKEGWKLVHEHYSTLPPQAAPAAAEAKPPAPKAGEAPPRPGEAAPPGASAPRGG